MRIIVAGGGTGGHLYPGLAIARALLRLAPQVRPLFIGAQRGIEREVLPRTGFEHELLDLHPIYRRQPWRSWRTLVGLVSAWRRIGRRVDEERPAAVVGTGGYAAGAMLAYAATHRIPLVLQEQNSFAGLTVRGFSRYAREVYLGFPEAEHGLRPGRRTVVVDTGNPIDPPPSPRPDRAAARARWNFPADRGRVLLVFGGSQGSLALNQAVDAWLGRGVSDDLYIIWATGRHHYERFAPRTSNRVTVTGYLSPIAEAYAAADFALTRAGAMTTAELCAWGIPSILVPLPTAAADHQTANAVALERAGAAIHLPQRALDAASLDARVGALLHDGAQLERLARGALARGRPDAAETIARRILTLLDLKQLRS